MSSYHNAIANGQGSTSEKYNFAANSFSVLNSGESADYSLRRMIHRDIIRQLPTTHHTSFVEIFFYNILKFFLFSIVTITTLVGVNAFLGRQSRTGLLPGLEDIKDLFQEFSPLELEVPENMGFSGKGSAKNAEYFCENLKVVIKNNLPSPSSRISDYFHPGYQFELSEATTYDLCIDLLMIKEYFVPRFNEWFKKIHLNRPQSPLY